MLRSFELRTATTNTPWPSSSRFSSHAPHYCPVSDLWKRKYGYSCPYTQPAGEYSLHKRRPSTGVGERPSLNEERRPLSSQPSPHSCTLCGPEATYCDHSFGSGFCTGVEGPEVEEEEPISHATRHPYSDGRTTRTTIPCIYSPQKSKNAMNHPPHLGVQPVACKKIGEKTVGKGRKRIRGETSTVDARPNVPTLLEVHQRVIDSALREISRPREGPFENLGERLGGDHEDFTYCSSSTRLSECATLGVSTPALLPRSSSLRHAFNADPNSAGHHVDGESNRVVRRKRVSKSRQQQERMRLPSCEKDDSGYSSSRKTVPLLQRKHELSSAENGRNTPVGSSTSREDLIINERADSLSRLGGHNEEKGMLDYIAPIETNSCRASNSQHYQPSASTHGTVAQCAPSSGNSSVVTSSIKKVSPPSNIAPEKHRRKSSNLVAETFTLYRTSAIGNKIPPSPSERVLGERSTTTEENADRVVLETGSPAEDCVGRGQKEELLIHAPPSVSKYEEEPQGSYTTQAEKWKSVSTTTESSMVGQYRFGDANRSPCQAIPHGKLAKGQTLRGDDGISTSGISDMSPISWTLSVDAREKPVGVNHASR